MKKLIAKNFEVIVLAAILTGCSSLQLERSYKMQMDEHIRNKTNYFINRFPLSLPRTAKVRKYETNNPKYCLVHILQAHVSAFNKKKLNSSCNDKVLLEQINSVQNDIYDILIYLKFEKGIKYLYQEGLFKDDKIWDERHPGRKLFYFLEYPKQNLSEEIEFWNYKVNLEKKEKYKKILEEKLRLRETMSEKYPFLAGASFLMADDDLLRLKYGENGDFYKEGLEGNLSFYAERDNHELRENALLEMIVKNRDEIAVVVFGGAHCWKNNIRRWNKMHRNEKFSLIEIVPESYYQKYGEH